MLSLSKLSRAVLAWSVVGAVGAIELSAVPAYADVDLIDGANLQYTIKTELGADTMLKASGAASEANFTVPVPATTTFGGVFSNTLTDMFDGYAGLGISFDATVPALIPTTTGAHYNQNGAATLDASCDNRQLLFAAQTITNASDNLQVSRKVFVPANDSFIRWLNVVHNPGSNPITFHIGFASDLGSDNDTRITGSSSGDSTAEITDTWVATMENYDSNGLSSDPRIGHVLQGAGSLSAPLASLQIVDGNQRLFWWYTLTLAGGATQSIMTFATGQPSKTAAASKAADLAELTNAHALDCLSTQERKQVVNFRVQCTQPGDVGTGCDDNDLCTVDDVCTIGGVCAGQAKACRSDAADCTGVCNPSTGACEENNVPDGTSCFNGNACDGADACQAGACAVIGTPPDCNDHNPCTTDSCTLATGCSNLLNAGCVACGTGEDAGTDDDSGVVAGSCGDDNVCNGVETCGTDATCHAGNPLNCDDGDPCTVDSCVRARGCEHETLEGCEACDDDTDCSDGNLCDGREVCGITGVCEDSKELLDCDDDNDCTADECIASEGCVHTPLSIGRCAAVGGSGGGSGGAGGAGGGKAGPGAAGESADAGPGDASVDGGAAGDDDGCDCSTTGSGRETSALLWLLVLGWIRRRRAVL